MDKFWKEDIYEQAMNALENSDAQTLEEYIREQGMPIGKIMNCIRLALSGASSGLGIADIMSFIGKEKTLERMRFAKQRLG